MSTAERGTPLFELVDTSNRVAAISGRIAKIDLLASFLTRLAQGEVCIATGFLIGWPRQNKIGVGWAAVSAARKQPSTTEPALTLLAVDETLTAIAAAKGNGRTRILEELFSRATDAEQRFLGALLVGEVRQGALEGVLAEAVAKAAMLSSSLVRRAVMMAGDLGAVAETALGENAEERLGEYQLQLFRPVQVMLADSADTVADAMTSADPVTIEWKLDGARIQVHAEGDQVAVYTRNLNDVTDAVPEVVEAVRSLATTDIILDGEVIALADDQSPRAFQTTMRRFGRRLDVDALRAEIPLTPYFFDILRLNGSTLIDEPFTQRIEELDRVLDGRFSVPRITTSSVETAAEFQQSALAKGHEGVMVKTLDAPYAAGRRGSAWIKVKMAKTLDLVVLAVEWGSGRRAGTLSNIHLGARDPDTGGFVMLGKTFKGMTDEILTWQTKEFLARETHRDGHVVYVRPEVVVEIAFNEVQQSSQYPGGVALRFARVKGYRTDKNATEADTIDTVRRLMSPV